MSVRGIEECVELRKLSLSKNKIGELGDFSKLGQIKELLLSNNPI